MNKKAEKYHSEILSEIFDEISPQEQKRTDNRMLLAAKIKDGMNAKGWRKTHLAEVLGKKNSVITKWLSGTHNFTSDTLSDIQDVLGIKLLAVDEKKEPQVIHYHIQVSSTSVNTEEECQPNSTLNAFFSMQNKYSKALC
jgi:ribosome-binding protein aMBF1 (putative translation factor)